MSFLVVIFTCLLLVCGAAAETTDEDGNLICNPSLEILYNMINIQSVQVKYLSDRIERQEEEIQTLKDTLKSIQSKGGAHVEQSEVEGVYDVTMKDDVHTEQSEIEGPIDGAAKGGANEERSVIEKSCNITMRDCLDLYKHGKRQDGIYLMDPALNGHIIRAFCDMSTNGGGWTVIQQRVDDSVDFYRNRSEYIGGFGDPNGNTWLGLDQIYALTNSNKNDITELYVYLMDFDGHTGFAKYSNFSISDSSDNYRLHVSGYNGTAGDSLAYHNGQQFSTHDYDVDSSSNNCALQDKGAWWYTSCNDSNLNGVYLQGGVINRRGINWVKFKTTYYSYKTAMMKIRRHSS